MEHRFIDDSLSLHTDLYQINMAETYWRDGIHEKKAVFELFFRKLPFDNGFAVFAGLEKAIEYLSDFSFTESDLAYLKDELGYKSDFIEYLSGLSFTGTLHSMREGEIVFANEPIMRIEATLVFVHGINSSSSTWSDRNDMAKQAVLNGYESAFIDLYPDQDMKKNGKLLAEKLKEIYEFFGRKLIIIGHSKGGVDTQAALVYYNAHPFVEKVITLGSPHYGTPLADLAYSKGGSWLAQILGMIFAVPVYALLKAITLNIVRLVQLRQRSRKEQHLNV